VSRPKKPKRGRPVGSGNGNAEASVLVTGPALLLAAVAHDAAREGVTVREWWRRAARVRLGWREVVESE
jgi:hypothetical protein